MNSEEYKKITNKIRRLMKAKEHITLNEMNTARALIGAVNSEIENKYINNSLCDATIFTKEDNKQIETFNSIDNAIKEIEKEIC